MEAMEVKLEAVDEAVVQLAKDGYDPKYGARPLRRTIQEKVEDVVAEQLLEGRPAAGDAARIVLQDGSLCVTKD
jgi:ATP-dependent Clp protease ATP-binding subunit ClpC